MLSGTSFTKKGVKSIISSTNGLVTGHLSIRLNAMLEAVKFPAGISDLDTGLTNVNRDALPHFQISKNPKKDLEREMKTEDKVGVYEDASSKDLMK
jgi:hypothetical protein